MADEWQQTGWQHRAQRADARAFGKLVKAIKSWARTNDSSPLELVVEQLQDTWRDEWQRETIDLPKELVEHAFALVEGEDADEELSARLGAARALFVPVPDSTALRVHRSHWHYFEEAVKRLQKYVDLLDEGSVTYPLVADAVRFFRSSARTYLFGALASHLRVGSEAGRSRSTADCAEECANERPSRTALELIDEGFRACCHPFDGELGLGPWYGLLDSKSAGSLIPSRPILDQSDPLHFEVFESMGGTVLSQAPAMGKPGPLFWAEGLELASFVRKLDFSSLELCNGVEELAEQELEAAELPVTDEAVEALVERWRQGLRAAFERFVDAAQGIEKRGEVLLCWDECLG